MDFVCTSSSQCSDFVLFDTMHDLYMLSQSLRHHMYISPVYLGDAISLKLSTTSGSYNPSTFSTAIPLRMCMISSRLLLLLSS